jgi:hypothetical protein
MRDLAWGWHPTRVDSTDAVAGLIKTYEGVHELHVQYRPGSWSTPGESDYALLSDPLVTSPANSDSRDRLIHREALEVLATQTPVDDVQALRRLFVVVMAWGSGKSNPRSYRFTRAALADARLDGALRTTAEVCRRMDVSALGDAYQRWRVAGVQRSFFTKWFHFSGYVPNRSWQPLVLDDRVLRTLNSTLDLSTRDMAGSTRWAARYAAYVHLVHDWAGAFDGVTPQRIEWVMFTHNGRDLTDTSTDR